MGLNAHLRKIFEVILIQQMKGVNRLARKRDPKRNAAFELFKKHDGDITNREIAKLLAIDEKKIAVWKGRDKWINQLNGLDECCTTKSHTTTKSKSTKNDIRSYRKKQVIDALVEAGTYSPALDLLIEIYLDAYEEYQEYKNEKLRKELAKYLGQLGLDGKNKELIKKSGVLLEKGDEEKEKEKEPAPVENSKLVQFRQRMQR